MCTIGLRCFSVYYEKINLGNGKVNKTVKIFRIYLPIEIFDIVYTLFLNNLTPFIISKYFLSSSEYLPLTLLKAKLQIEKESSLFRIPQKYDCQN